MTACAEQDLACIQQILAGSEKAFERLYRRYEARVYGLAYRLTGNASDAQDVLQDSFIRCYDALSQYRGEAPFWAWLKQLTIRTALMRIRRQRRWQFVAVEQVPEISTPGPESARIDSHDLERALHTLSPAARAVLWLYHGEGFSHGEIATMWGKSVSFSKSQLARAQHKLRGRLPDEENEYSRRSIPVALKREVLP